MKILLTYNIVIDLDITNRAIGEIADIILNPNEPPHENKSIVHLDKLPLYIMVKLSRTCASYLNGLKECVVPVVPITNSI